MEITKAMWNAWPRLEKRRHKNGDCYVFNKTDRTWVKVWWRR